ncbi:sialate O-acetylesterase [Caldicellulosiruptor changbaiensis]|uniref:Sialate O-acetylesterase n=1 Tax=Caldicellulosiruptor changbaiensis TaxID=1222016 RepID=A0A3T0D291_9FIRM|nr:sialate O-acetylesterase [Caldicellulosiruptor changbaiensis]AZT89381.1 sialate O-acetylesterase [Caldicellulosiruptor changbaiensis]
MPLRLPLLLSDGMVLQRDKKVKIWGWAEPRETVTVNFSGKSYMTVTDDDGKWEVTLPPMQPGGPYSMEIKSQNSVITIKDILIGDVWVCSGQSNMVVPMERVIDIYKEELDDCDIPLIRQFTVPDRYHFKGPKEDLEGGSWEPLNKETVFRFSAVGYFFAKALFRRYNVPIGLIKACVGGTPIEAWMSKDIVYKFLENPEELEKLKDDSYIESVKKEQEAKIKAWFDYLDTTDIGLKNQPLPFFDENYSPSDWKIVNIPATWKEMGLDSTIGVVWFRKEIDIPSCMAGKPAKLYLGTIVDSDFTYVNGKLIGSTSYRYPPRKYNIPAGILKEGKNTIVVRVISNDGNGEFVKGKEYKIFTEDCKLDLKGQWLCKVGAQAKEPLPPQTFWQYKPTGLFNGMIAPLLNYSIKGIIWYQGESNTDRPEGYCKKLCALVEDWRKKWGDSNLPFLYVQLANFMEAKPQPCESNWARLREEQRRALLFLDNVGMAVAIDLGEWNDLHPSNKKDVGERLALLAQKVAYGEKDLVASGPLYKSMKIEGNKAVLEFSEVGSGLVAKGGDMLKHFAIAGKDKKFVWANAAVEGDKVVVWHDSIQNPVYVRYAWADNPEGANLYNKEGLPASPFTTEDEI